MEWTNWSKTKTGVHAKAAEELFHPRKVMLIIANGESYTCVYYFCMLYWSVPMVSALTKYIAL